MGKLFPELSGCAWHPGDCETCYKLVDCLGDCTTYYPTDITYKQNNTESDSIMVQTKIVEKEIPVETVVEKEVVVEKIVEKEVPVETIVEKEVVVEKEVHVEVSVIVPDQMEEEKVELLSQLLQTSKVIAEQTKILVDVNRLPRAVYNA